MYNKSICLKIFIIILLILLIIIEATKTIIIFQIQDIKLITSFVSTVLGILLNQILKDIKSLYLKNKENKKTKRKKVKNDL